MKTLILFLFASLLFSACQFNKSVNTDLLTGLTTTGDGLSSENVYLTIDDQKISHKSFVYGETFYLNFNNMEGFVKNGDKVFPGMKLFVIGKKGDTIMHADDMYTKYDADGISLSPLLLVAHLTVGKPIKSNNEYTLVVKIWDKKGKGTFSAKMDFKVEANPKIAVEKNKANCDEIYLFSKESSKVILNKIKSDETVYMIFEGVSGFAVQDSTVYPGVSLTGTDPSGKILFKYDDLFEEYSKTGVYLLDFQTQLSAHFKLSDLQVKGPVHCEVIIWDKKSDSKIKALADLTVE